MLVIHRLFERKNCCT